MTRKPTEFLVEVESGLLQLQLARLLFALEAVSKRRAQRFLRKALRLLHDLRLDQVSDDSPQPTTATCHMRVQIYVVGLDELIAAALRAGKLSDCHGGLHAKSQEVKHG